MLQRKNVKKTANLYSKISREIKVTRCRNAEVPLKVTTKPLETVKSKPRENTYESLTIPA